MWVATFFPFRRKIQKQTEKRNPQTSSHAVGGSKAVKFYTADRSVHPHTGHASVPRRAPHKGRLPPRAMIPPMGCSPLALTLVACDLWTSPRSQGPLSTAMTDNEASGSSVAGRTLARKKKPKIEFSVHQRVACAYSSSHFTKHVCIRCILWGSCWRRRGFRREPRLRVCGAGLQFPP